MTTDADADRAEQVYDPAEFRVAGTDGKGHFKRVWLNVLPLEFQQMLYVLSAKRFPYRGVGDLIRHAVYRHLRWLEGLEPVKSVTGQADLLLEMLQEEELQLDFGRTFEKLGGVISRHLTMGAQGQARKVLATAVAVIEGMPHGYWRDTYAKEIKNRYGHLLDSGQKVGLIGRKEDKE